MKQEIKFKAHHIPTDKDYWFDVMWGNTSHGTGYIGMLPIEQTKKIDRIIYEDRIPVDPNECEITRFHDHKNEQALFEKAVRPLMEYLGTCDPHQTVIVTNKMAQLVSGEHVFETDEYLVD